MNPKELDEAVLKVLLYETEGFLCDIERATLLCQYDSEKYAAVYQAVFFDDGSFPDEETRLNGCKIFISFKPNGKLIAQF